MMFREARRVVGGVGRLWGVGSMGFRPAVCLSSVGSGGERELTKHEKSLFVSDSPEELPRMADQGFRFHTLPDQLEGRSEKVQRALSTFTASRPELRTFRRHQLIRRFREHLFDTGSVRVQVALLTEQITALNEHTQAHKKDKDAKRRLAMAVSKRRRFLRYLMKSDYSSYRAVIRDLGFKHLPVFESRYKSTRGRVESHKAIHEKNARIKNRKSRGYKGH